MATGVVLYHRSQGQQVEVAARLPLGPSTTADIMGQQGALQGDRSGSGDAGHANQASSALQTPSSPVMGVQSGGVTNSPTLHGYDVRGDVQVVLRTAGGMSGIDRGRRPKLQSPGYSGK